VGQERYQFDIWGDTVNVAALMVGMSAREAWL
jgi:class 3 adenylate cyclase